MRFRPVNIAVVLLLVLGLWKGYECIWFGSELVLGPATQKIGAGAIKNKDVLLRLVTTTITAALAALLFGLFQAYGLQRSSTRVEPRPTISPLTLARSTSSGKRDDGPIHLITGPMYSGKTKRLIERRDRERRRCQRAGTITLLIKFSGDKRYSTNDVVSHNQSRDSDTVVCNKLSEVDEQVCMPRVVAVFIDEGQFYGDTPLFVRKWASLGKRVEIAQLDAYAVNFNHEKQKSLFWSGWEEIYLMATKVTRLTAICTDCGRETGYSYILPAGLSKLASSSSVPTTLIGGKPHHVLTMLLAPRCHPHNHCCCLDLCLPETAWIY